MKKWIVTSVILWMLLSGGRAHAEVFARKSEPAANDWIRIVDQYVEEVSAEEFFVRKNRSDRQEERVRLLKVKIEFLKPCAAIRKFDSLRGNEPSLSADQRAFIIAYKEWEEARDKKQGASADRILEEIMSIPECGDIKDDLLLYQFRCDPSVRVFVSFFSSEGRRIEEVERVPKALQMNYLQERLKTKMFPGETMWMPFIVPDEAESWRIVVFRK